MEGGGARRRRKRAKEDDDDDDDDDDDHGERARPTRRRKLHKDENACAEDDDDDDGEDDDDEYGERARPTRRRKLHKDENDAMVGMAECIVCYLPFNKALRRPVRMACSCDGTACMECVRSQFAKHLTPRCLTCPNTISEIGARQMTGGWMSSQECKQLRADLFADVQRNVRPDITQAALERQGLQSELEAQVKMLRRQRDELNRKLKKLNGTLGRLENAQREGRRMFQSNPNDIPSSIQRARALLATVTADSEAADPPTEAPPTEAADASPPAAVPVLFCPRSDCRGIMSGRACSVCGTRCCPACRSMLAGDEVLDGEAGSATHRLHQCDPATLASIATINSNSKACPRCFVPIERSSGCNHMYCTRCHQFFNYTTGLPISGIVHNPEYVAEQARARCGRDYFSVPSRSFFKNSDAARNAFVRLTSFLRDRQQFHDQFPLATPGDPFLETRVNLQSGSIDLKEFGRRLLAIHTFEARRMEWGLLARTLFDWISDITVNVGSDGRSVFEYCTQVENLYDVINEAAQKISFAFEVVRPRRIHELLEACSALVQACGNIVEAAPPAAAPAVEDVD